MSAHDGDDNEDDDLFLAPYRVQPPKAPPLPPLPPGPEPPLPTPVWMPPPLPPPVPVPVLPDEGDFSGDFTRQEHFPYAASFREVSVKRPGPDTVVLIATRPVEWRRGALCFQAWMTRHGDRPWVFPSMALGKHGWNMEAALQHVLHRQRRAMPPDDYRDLERALHGARPQCTLTLQNDLVVLHVLPRKRHSQGQSQSQSQSQRLQLPLPPTELWVTEGELAHHEDVGRPGALGVPMASWALQQWEALPLEWRFASPTPPLVLYHGTEAKFVDGIRRRGLLPGPASATAMLGSGVYLARWDKAVDFARHDVENRARATAGVVCRVALLLDGVPPEGTVVLTAEDVCACGCGRAYVDHLGLRGHEHGVVVVAVPDNAGSATRRAEWCVKAAARLVVLDCYALPQ